MRLQRVVTPPFQLLIYMRSSRGPQVPSICILLILDSHPDLLLRYPRRHSIRRALTDEIGYQPNNGCCVVVG